MKRETPKEAKTKKQATKPRKPREAKMRTPSDKTSSSSRNKPKDKEGAKTVEWPLDQRGEIVLTFEKPDLSTVVPGQYLPQYLPPNPHLPWQPKDIERRRLQAHDPQFLISFERTLEKKIKDINDWTEELGTNPHNLTLRDQIVQTQSDVRIIRDNIQRIKDRAYHLR